ncbi:MAG: DoxX family protein [Chlorobiota bacterium]|nr:DoxX family protein [Chlorobiota bacterium]QQS66075.1 MAG: DoxX family protein [Chlorobiota bacterium]
MKNTKKLYWTFSILFAAFMAFTAIPDVLMSKEAVDFINKLGYPTYFIPFIGVAKILGSIAILIPNYPRIKEWAYAGLFYDLIAACYSQICTNGFQFQMMFMILPLTIGILSYYFNNEHYKIS